MTRGLIRCYKNDPFPASSSAILIESAVKPTDHSVTAQTTDLQQHGACSDHPAPQAHPHHARRTRQRGIDLAARATQRQTVNTLEYPAPKHDPRRHRESNRRLPAFPTPTTDPPAPACQPAKQDYKIAYGVHEKLPDNTTRFIGLITVISLLPYHLSLPPDLVIPKAQESNTLVTELAYSFLPYSWGRGYATESLCAVLDAVRSPADSLFWAPWEKVWMRVIVNWRNPASLNVMRKLEKKGVVEKGVFEWKGEKIFIGGEWRTEDDLFIFGAWLRE
jgi:RimJ/RimL family protein N-acetyltransferase